MATPYTTVGSAPAAGIGGANEASPVISRGADGREAANSSPHTVTPLGVYDTPVGKPRTYRLSTRIGKSPENSPEHAVRAILFSAATGKVAIRDAAEDPVLPYITNLASYAEVKSHTTSEDDGGGGGRASSPDLDDGVHTDGGVDAQALPEGNANYFSETGSGIYDLATPDIDDADGSHESNHADDNEHSSHDVSTDCSDRSDRSRVRSRISDFSADNTSDVLDTASGHDMRWNGSGITPKKMRVRSSLMFV